MDKGIELIKKVKADIARCTEIVRESNDIYMVQNAALMIKKINVGLQNGICKTRSQ